MGSGEACKILKDGKKRQLVFKKIQMSDEGFYTCKTNSDETQCELIVTYENKFKRKLQDTTSIETTETVFEIEMIDHKSEVEWFMKGEKITPSERFTMKNMGNGVHRLIIN